MDFSIYQINNLCKKLEGREKKIQIKLTEFYRINPNECSSRNLFLTMDRILIYRNNRRTKYLVRAVAETIMTMMETNKLNNF
jgi:hypothetical protein